MRDINYCTDQSGRWPDTFLDVSPDELDEFFDHMELCPYHAEMFSREDEPFRSVFRVARGLDRHGRLLLGEELQSVVAEHERLTARWVEEAAKRELPFSYISLYNNGDEIARCANFYDLTKHDALHELDPDVGLQIWGMIGGETGEAVMLGFYALAGVPHGEEYVLPLENGYTLGLKVHQRDSTLFRIEFRCIESDTIEKEQGEASTETNEQASGTAAGGGSSASHLCPDAATLEEETQFYPIPSWQPFVSHAAYLLLIAVLTISVFKMGAQHRRGVQVVSTLDIRLGELKKRIQEIVRDAEREQAEHAPTVERSPMSVTVAALSKEIKRLQRDLKNANDEKALAQGELKLLTEEAKEINLVRRELARKAEAIEMQKVLLDRALSERTASAARTSPSVPWVSHVRRRTVLRVTFGTSPALIRELPTLYRDLEASSTKPNYLGDYPDYIGSKANIIKAGMKEAERKQPDVKPDEIRMDNPAPLRNEEVSPAPSPRDKDIPRNQGGKNMSS